MSIAETTDKNLLDGHPRRPVGTGIRCSCTGSRGPPPKGHATFIFKSEIVSAPGRHTHIATTFSFPAGEGLRHLGTDAKAFDTKWQAPCRPPKLGSLRLPKGSQRTHNALPRIRHAACGGVHTIRHSWSPSLRPDHRAPVGPLWTSPKVPYCLTGKRYKGSIGIRHYLDHPRICELDSPKRRPPPREKHAQSIPVD